MLFLVFGSLFAMAMPLASALIALGTAISVIGLVSKVMTMPVFSTELVLLIGLGVGVDYALFIVSRHRQGLQAGRSVQESVELAIDTSGRAVLFAGTIVCVALLGMFTLGISFLYGLAVASSIGVLFTMVAALTLLPAMLGFVGPKILSRKQRRTLAAEGPHGSRKTGSGFDGPAPSRRARCCSARSRCSSSWPWRPRSSGCGSAPPIRGTTRSAARPARRTTCWPKGSVPGSTARCSWSPRPPIPRRPTR